MRYLFFIIKTSFIFFLLCANQGFAQNGVYQYHGRFIHQGKVYKGTIKGNLGTSSVNSNSEGEFRVAVPNTSSISKLVLEEGWKILFPIDGWLPATSDENYIWEIHIEKSGSGSDLEKVYKKLQELGANNRADKKAVRTLLSQSFSDQEELLNQFNDEMISSLEAQMNLYEKLKKENDRKEELALQVEKEKLTQGKRLTINSFTEHLDHYVSRALDLKDAFEQNNNRVFNNNKVLLQLSEKVKAYSEAYEALNKNRKAIVNDVETFWQDENRSRDARELLDYALEDIHKHSFLPANQLISDINEYNLGKVKKRKRRKKELTYDIRRFVTETNYKIDTLKEKKERIFQKLNDS